MSDEKAGRQPCFDFLDELIVPDPLDEQLDDEREQPLRSSSVAPSARTMINMHTKGRVIE